ncbi:hypothetical protein KC19_9G095300 [Ceratodon purpureus]|uniref:AP2/ERF domain-containing protein n=1 Tax=Ceratodon purpureus TaxID=3225 RepID=A0A8T0GTE8_CERPU|nr:hypothetical protein KC19_9G095300 [Ceratodon purpureus]
MAFAIDTKYLLEEYIPDMEQDYNDSLHEVSQNRGRRLQLHRVCVYATIIHGDLMDAQDFEALEGVGDSRERVALDWQSEQGDDEDEVEVLHHLKQLAAIRSAPKKPGISCSLESSASKAGTTSLVASVQSRAFTSCTQERPPSSFHRYSVRQILLDNGSRHDDYRWYSDCTDLKKVIPNFTTNRIYADMPQLVFRNSKGSPHYSALFVVQSDFLELSSHSTYFPSSPGKRRRTLNPFHRVSQRREELDTSRAAHHSPPDAKRFKGVRYRPERNRWVAEMKPPKSRNKVSFGDFQCQTEAARVVDVAFHHYGKPLNFADTPQILSKLPSSAALNAEEKLKLVKDQAEWIKSRISGLPATSTPCAGAAAPITADTLGLNSLLEISSTLFMGGSDEADGSVSEPPPWVHLMAGFVADHGVEARVSLAGRAGAVDESERSIADALADASDMGSNPECSSGILSNAVNFTGLEQASGMQSMYINFHRMSPAILQPWSPGEFPGDGLSWEEHNIAMCMSSVSEALGLGAD